MNNYFGIKLIDLAEIFSKENTEILRFIKNQLKPLYSDHKVDLEKDFGVIRDNIENYKDKETEKKIIQDLEINTKSNDEDALINRARIIANQITPSIKETFVDKNVTIADIGCGDGLVPYILKKEKHIVNITKPILLTDVTDYRHQDVKKDADFEFLKTDQEQWNGSLLEKRHKFYDVVLLLTVLHHSSDPSFILSNIPLLLDDSGLLIIIESCIGITESDLPDDSTEDIKTYAKFSLEQQMLYGSFMDWFYNRWIHYKDDVPVPFNFSTPKKWNELIQEYGLNNIDTKILGFDQKLVPEFHTIHLFKKNING